MSDAKSVCSNLAAIIADIRKTAENCGRLPDSVKLVAVSKFFPAEDILLASECGQIDFGESKIQELTAKCDFFSKHPRNICWHLIGHLQSNKVKNAVELADLIHSVDSCKLIEKLNAAAEVSRKRCRILLEFNISGELSKHGLFPEQAREAVACALNSPMIELCGLMTMAPEGVDYQTQLTIFSALRDLRDYLESEFAITLPELSMGMSQDYHAAIVAGSTMVRVGSAIFGGRNYGTKA